VLRSSLINRLIGCRDVGVIFAEKVFIVMHAFHDADTDILATILARMSARMSV